MQYICSFNFYKLPAWWHTRLSSASPCASWLRVWLSGKSIKDILQRPWCSSFSLFETCSGLSKRNSRLFHVSSCVDDVFWILVRILRVSRSDWCPNTRLSRPGDSFRKSTQLNMASNKLVYGKFGGLVDFFNSLCRRLPGLLRLNSMCLQPDYDQPKFLLFGKCISRLSLWVAHCAI